MPFTKLPTKKNFDNIDYDEEYGKAAGQRLTSGIIEINHNDQLLKTTVDDLKRNKTQRLMTVFRDSTTIISDLDRSSTRVARLHCKNIWGPTLYQAFNENIISQMERDNYPLTTQNLREKSKSKYPVGLFYSQCMAAYVLPYAGTNRHILLRANNTLMRIQEIIPAVFTNTFNAKIRFYVEARVPGYRTGMAAVVCGTFQEIPQSLLIGSQSKTQLTDNHIVFKFDKFLFDHLFYYHYLKHQLFYNPISINIKDTFICTEIINLFERLTTYANGLKKQSYENTGRFLKTAKVITPFILGYILQSAVYMAIFNEGKKQISIQTMDYIAKNAGQIKLYFDNLTELKSQKDEYQHLREATFKSEISYRLMKAATLYNRSPENYAEFAQYFLYAPLKLEGLADPKFRVAEVNYDPLRDEPPLKLAEPIDQIIFNRQIFSMFYEDIREFLKKIQQPT